MTESSQKRGLPVWALMLDILGTVLLAVGIYIVVGGKLPIADGPELAQIGIVMIIVGALLMMPLVIVIVQRLVGQK